MQIHFINGTKEDTDRLLIIITIFCKPKEDTNRLVIMITIFLQTTKGMELKKWKTIIQKNGCDVALSVIE